MSLGVALDLPFLGHKSSDLSLSRFCSIFILCPFLRSLESVNHNNDDHMMNVNDCNHYWVDDDDDNDDLLDGHDNSWTAIGVERTHGQRMDHDCVVVDYC